MVFNSLEFLIFLPIVVLVYAVIPARRRWFVMLVASYWFYMSWRVEYIGLIVASTLVDYLAA
ncbi:MAG: MBOAT family protein, partial [Alkalispirochaeta sp.]